MTNVASRALRAPELLEELKAKYPEKKFQVDHVTGKIGFEFEGMFITDPWLSECGRFEILPNYYGLKVHDALRVKAFNLPIEQAEEVKESLRQAWIDAGMPNGAEDA